MATIVEVKVPDIGDFKDIPIIEVFVKAGDTVKAEDPLISLESDKATMDVPSPVDGVVKDTQGQARRQGVRRLADPHRRRRRRAGGRRAAAENQGRRPCHGRGCACGRLRYVGCLRVDRRSRSRHRRLQGHSDHRGVRQGGRHGEGRGPAHFARIGQGHDGCAFACRGYGVGPEGEGRRQGVGRQSHPHAVDRCQRRGVGRAAGARRCTTGGCRRGAETGCCVRGWRRHRMRDAGAGCGAWRLLCGVPFRRPRHEDGADRTLRDAGRRLSQRRLHPVEGAAAHGGRDGRSQSAGRARDQVRARRRSTSTSCAGSRKA